MYDQKKQVALDIAQEAQSSGSREKQALSWLIKDRLGKEERREKEFMAFVDGVRKEVRGN